MNWRTMTNADVERFARGEPEEKRRLSRKYEPGEIYELWDQPDWYDCPPDSDDNEPSKTL